MASNSSSSSSSTDPLIETRKKMEETLSKREEMGEDWKNEYKKQYSEHYEKLSKEKIYTKEYRKDHIISKYVKEHIQYKQDIENGRRQLYDEEFYIWKSDVLKKLKPDMDFEFHYYYDGKQSSFIQPTILHIIRSSRGSWTKVFEAITEIYPPERIQEWLKQYIKICDNADEMYYGTPLEYSLFRGRDKLFQLIWEKLDAKDSFIQEKIEIHEPLMQLVMNKLLEYDGSLVKRWFSYDHVRDYDASYKMLQLLYSKIRVFDMIPTVVNKLLTNTLERAKFSGIRESSQNLFVEATFLVIQDFFMFHKEVTGFNFNLKKFVDDEIKIRNLWKRLSYHHFKRYCRLVELPEQILGDLLLIPHTNENNDFKLEKLFEYKTHDLSFHLEANAMNKYTKDHRKFNILLGQLEYDKRQQYAASVLNINEQEKLLERLKRERGETREIILQYLKDLKEITIEQKEGDEIVSLKEIEFSHCPTVSNAELDEMSQMGVDKIPFCYFLNGEDDVKWNIDKKNHKGLQYFLVKKQNKIVAFIAYEQYNVYEYYIAWECATHRGYAQALKLLVFCHAYDAKMIRKVTLDLCGGHWLSHPSARKINLKFGFRYNDLKSVYDQAEKLCEQNDCSLKELQYLIFKKDKTTVTNDEYIKIRKKLKATYFEGKDDNYPMSCTVAPDHIIKLLVIVQESQCGYLQGIDNVKKRAQLKSDIHATNDLIGGSSIEGRTEVNTTLNRERKRQKTSSSTRKFKKGEIVQTMWKPTNGESGDAGLADAKIVQIKKNKWYELQWHPLPEEKHFQKRFNKREKDLIKK